MNNRNRTSPVPLTSNTPITETVVGSDATNAHVLERGGDCFKCIFKIQPIKLSRVNSDPGLFTPRLLAEIIFRVISYRLNNGLNGQTILRRKFPITLIMARDRHHRTRPVIHQYKVGDPDRNLFTGEWMNHIFTGCHALLRCLSKIGFGDGHTCAFFDERSDFWFRFCSFFRNRMLCGHGHIGNTHDGIWARCIDLESFLGTFKFKTELHTLTSSDPVFLHRLDLFGPINRIQII